MPPEDVTDLEAQATHVGTDAAALLTWTASVDSAGDLASYRVYVEAGNSGLRGNNPPTFDNGLGIDVPPSRTTFLVAGLSTDTHYVLTLTSVDAVPNESAGVAVAIDIADDPTQYVTMSRTLTSDTTLTAGVYRFNTVSIPAGVVLRLRPGAIVKFGLGGSLTVDGGLEVIGAEDDPVWFTSINDDSVGGDTNGDGPSEGAPGDWDRIVYSAGADPQESRFQNGRARFGGRSNSAMVQTSYVAVPFVGSEFTHSARNGLGISQATTEVRDNVMADNGQSGLVLWGYSNAGSSDPRRNASIVAGNTITRNGDHGIYSDYAGSHLSDNTITDNGKWGIYWASARNVPPIEGHTITGNGYGIRIPISAFSSVGNTFTPNDTNYFTLLGNSLVDDVHLGRWGEGQPGEVGLYFIETGVVTVPVNTTMTVDPGIVLKFSGNGINVYGDLIAEGTLEQKVIFTSKYDVTAGGNPTNVTNAAVNGNWSGISFYNLAVQRPSILDHVRVRFAGSSNESAIYQQRAHVTIRNSEISNSSTNGIRLYESDAEVAGNEIWGNDLEGIRVDREASQPSIQFNRISSNASDGIWNRDKAFPFARNNQFFGNIDMAFRNDTTNDVDATQSWWGGFDGTGPFHATTNPDGTGGEVTDHVIYEPFQAEVVVPYAYRNFSAAAPVEAGALPAPTVVRGQESDVWDADSLRPNRTMVWDEDLVELAFSGLDPDERYRLRVTYFNGDSAESDQRLTDGADNVIHGPIRMPRTRPVQHEFAIPGAYVTAEGELTLRFVNENPATTIRVSVSEVYLIVDDGEVTPPLFLSVQFSDSDGSGDLSVGDEFWFDFSEAMDTTLIVDGTTDANDRLPTVEGRIYGDVNQTRWLANQRTVVVTLTEGFTLLGDELVAPNDLTDPYGNLTIGQQTLPFVDTVPPRLIALDWYDDDGDGAGSIGDRHVFGFSEAMDTSALRDGTGDANAHLRPQGGTRYGLSNAIAWSADGREVTVTMTEGFSIHGDELVVPSSFVTDVAGNPVVGTQRLQGRDTSPPSFVRVDYDDADGSGSVSLGDRFRFVFDEAMRTFAVSNGTGEANVNLSPAGKRYGLVNDAAWNDTSSEVSIGVTAGFTLSGDERVTAGDLLTDIAGNRVGNEIDLNTIDVVAPRVVSVQGKYLSPLSAVEDFALTVQFNGSMNATVVPAITVDSDGNDSPAAPGTGQWLTTRFENDTFTTDDIALREGMDGTLTVGVSGGQDPFGNVMTAQPEAGSFELDATAPPMPEISVASQDCSGATVAWNGYAAPADIAGFQVYVSDSGPIAAADGRTFREQISRDARSHEIEPLLFDVDYDIAIAAFDQVGNLQSAVQNVDVRIEQIVPPRVPFDVLPGLEPTEALIAWPNYNVGFVCGIAGFRIYVETQDFFTVNGLTPFATVDATDRSFTLRDLDRLQTYYVSIVAFNTADEFDAGVETRSWTDPYGGLIDRDVTVGAGETKVIDVLQDIEIVDGAKFTIAPGTTLRFAPDTGITVTTGELIANGTVFESVRLTSDAVGDGGAPAPGDWDGVRIRGGGSASRLVHTIIEYGHGLHIDSSNPTVASLTARRNATAGVRIDAGGNLTTDDALLVFNEIGALAAAGSTADISASVIRNNELDAFADETSTIVAGANWWGTADAARIGDDQVGGPVDFAGFLDYEPVLSAVIGFTGDPTVIVQEVELRAPARTAAEMRLSEDGDFEGVFYEPWADPATFFLSDDGGNKTVYAQYRSSTGFESDVVSVTLRYVNEGPIVESFSLTPDQVITRPLQITASATAVLGVHSMGLWFNGAQSVRQPGGAFSYRWDPRPIGDGIHTARIDVRDDAGNFTAEERRVVVALDLPPQPAINSPADGHIRATSPVSVSGSAEPFVDLRLRRNGFVVGTVQASVNGSWSVANIEIDEGDNAFVAVAFDSLGESTPSQAVNVVLDSGPPVAPILETIEGAVGEGVTITWGYPDEGERPSRIEVYRHTAPFTQVHEARRIATRDYDGLTQSGLHNDPSPPSGNLYYAVRGVDAAGNTSAPSNRLAITMDLTRPVLAVTYLEAGPYGSGEVEIRLTSDEPLGAPPTMTVSPYAASPVAVELTPAGDQQWTGVFTVLSSHRSGNATVRASARDTAGNEFSGVPQNGTFQIDADGPSASIGISAVPPVQITAAINVDVSLTMSEAAKEGTVPVLDFQPPVGASVRVPLIGSGAVWQGVLTLTPAMGVGFGRFAFDGFDAFDNRGQTITSGERFELYNTALPPPTAAPGSVRAAAEPFGFIKITWAAVDRAETYRVYRSPGECTVLPFELVASDLEVLEFRDQTPTDDAWCYHVTASRLGSESGSSSRAGAFSDRVPTDPPRNLSVAQDIRGLLVSWQSPELVDGVEVPIKYSVTRNGVAVRTVNTNGGQLDYSTFDYPQTGGLYEYVVYALDSVGNAAASLPFTHELLVGPVVALEAFVEHGEVPELSWAPGDPATVGYNVYRGEQQVNVGLIVEPRYEARFFSGSERVTYSVTAVDVDGEESPPRPVDIFPTTFEAEPNRDGAGAAQPLVAKYFNRIGFDLHNPDIDDGLVLETVDLALSVSGEVVYDSHEVVGRTVLPGATFTDEFVAPLGTAADSHVLTATASQAGELGARTIYERSFVFGDVDRPGPGIEMSLDDVPLAGGLSVVEVCMVNRGEASMDVITHKANGEEPGDISLSILNAEGLEIVRADYQDLPQGIVRIADGNAYARIGPGLRACVDIEIVVPESLQDGDPITFAANVATFYHRYDTDRREALDGVSGEMQSSITVTGYYGSAQADRELYANDDLVTVTGRALDRQTGLPVPNADLKIGFYIRGFEWYEPVTTDENGDYTYEFRPQAGLAGTFNVWAAHPEVVDILRQDEFEFFRLFVGPPQVEFRASKADTFDYRVGLVSAGDVTLTGIEVTARAFTIDEFDDEIPTDKVTGGANLPEGFEVLGGGEGSALPLFITAAIDAPDDVVLEYTISTAEGATVTFTAYVQLTEAVPVVEVTDPPRGFVDVSVDRGTVLNVPVTIKNEGLDVLRGAEANLPETIGWMTTNLPLNDNGRIDLGDIPVGGEVTFDVVLLPPENLEQGTYDDRFVITASNAQQEIVLRIFTLVTAAERGTLALEITNSIGRAVPDASVRLTNQTIFERQNYTADRNGELVVDDLQIGTWSYYVTAPGHRSIQGIAKIDADQTTLETAVLEKTLVTVNFRVEPVQFQDRYEIKIEQTFVTNVPKPVLVVDPPMVRFENVESGFETIFIAQVSNFGLKALDDVTIGSDDDGTQRLEPLIDFIPRLGAMETVEVPFRVTVYGAVEPPPDAPGCGGFDPSVGGTNLANAIKGLAAFMAGTTSSYFTQEQKAIIGAAIAAVLTYKWMKNFLGRTGPLAAIVTAVGKALLPCVNTSGNGNGGGVPSRPNYGNGTGASGCFAPGTPIAMADGSQRPIERIEFGDEVLTAGGKTSRVTRLYRRSSDHIRELRYRVADPSAKGAASDALRRLETTDEHRFWVNGKGWTSAAKIEKGDVLVVHGDLEAELVDTRRFATPTYVHNFDVEEHDSYFANGVWVHQKCEFEEEPVEMAQGSIEAGLASGLANEELGR